MRALVSGVRQPRWLRGAFPSGSRRCGSLAAAGLVLVAAWALPAAAQAAGPPILTAPALSAVGETTATLSATVNPNGRPVDDYHFQYIPLAAWEADGGEFGPGTIEAPAGSLPSGEAAVEVSASLTGLSPGAAYRARLFAHNSKGESLGPESAFAPLTAPQAFGSCGNEELRSGGPAVLVPAGAPSALLPDCRAYEQASPVDKGGLQLTAEFDKSEGGAAVDGQRVYFLSVAPLPGSDSGNGFNPPYLASRGPGGWTTHSLLTPQAYGEESKLEGWTPDFSHTFAFGRTQGEPNLTALISRSAADGSLTPIVPPTGNFVEPGVPGSSADGSVVLFEAQGTPVAAGGAPFKANLYAWDRTGGDVRLAGAFNDGAAPALGATAALSSQGPGLRQYSRDRHVVSADGASAYFKDSGSGQLYRRANPAEPQSPLNGAGECEDPALACTYHVSASEKTNGQGEGGRDPGGAAPAFFQAATEDGEEAFFTSSEKLTDDANTGPELEPAAIGRLTPGVGAPEDVKEGFLHANALGVAISPDGSHMYWANPLAHSIGRAALNPTTGEAENPEPEFIGAEEIETCFETHPLTEPGASHCAAAPRYVAADSEHVYWTNTGPLGGDEFGGKEAHNAILNGAGTIGRAKLNPGTEEAEDVQAEWIGGGTDPQGIAVDSEHVYWANAGGGPGHDTPDPTLNAIGRATIEGTAVDQKFQETGIYTPYGLALDADHLYFAAVEKANGLVLRAPKGGGSLKRVLVGEGKARGAAIGGGELYWTAPVEGKDVLGRMPLGDFDLEVGSVLCEDLAGCEAEYLKPQGTLGGLAADPAGHVYWSANGDTPANPGADLYRWSAAPDAEGHHLTDLTPDPAEEDGARVRGVLGASADGAYLYFAANGVLAANEGARGAHAAPGDCHRTSPGDPESEAGACNLYLAHTGQIAFIAPLITNPGNSNGDQRNWNLYQVKGSATKMATARVSPDGRALLFRSTEQLTSYDNHGIPEYYLYRDGQGLACVSCNPTGLAPGAGPALGSIHRPIGGASVGSKPTSAVLSRNLSASGGRVFFESEEALVGADVNGARDVYEWEAPGEGICSASAASYSSQNEGCLYLLSGGDRPEASYFIGADEAGENVFIMTRARYVGQDKDQLPDVYDARVGGGLTPQSPPAPKPDCASAEACREGPASAPPPLGSPASAGFSGQGNLRERSSCPRAKVRRHGHCVKRRHHNRKRHRNRRANR